MATIITKDIKFDRYGDISFLGNDINTLSSEQDIFYQNIMDRLISNFDDYRLYPELGANISGEIGSKVSPELETRIKNNIVAALTFDNFLEKRDFLVITFSRRDKVYIKITVFGSNALGLQERFEVNSIFHTSSGTLYAAD